MHLNLHTRASSGTVLLLAVVVASISGVSPVTTNASSTVGLIVNGAKITAASPERGETVTYAERAKRPCF
jgi:hypothetical protein